jgi:hypothetical protein
MTNYVNINQNVSSFAYSLTPELNDLLSRGIIYQKDLALTGAPFANAIGLTAAVSSFTYPLYALSSGPLLRQVQGSDGFRYMLARYDGTFATGGATITAGTSASALGILTVPTYPNGTAVYVSSGPNDLYTATLTGAVSGSTKIYTFGGFVDGTPGTVVTGTANAVYDASSWQVVAPANYYNGALVSPATSFVITVGDYYWLKLISGNAPTEEVLSKSKK